MHGGCLLLGPSYSLGQELLVLTLAALSLSAKATSGAREFRVSASRCLGRIGFKAKVRALHMRPLSQD